MAIGSMATHQFRVVRRTTWLMEAREVAASMAPDVNKCPNLGGMVELLLEGSELTGTITVTGEYQGSPQTEEVTASGPMGDLGDAATRAVLTTCKRFDCVTLIETTGLVGEPGPPTIAARFVGEGGHPLEINCELIDCVMGALEPRGGGGSWPVPRPGSVEAAGLILMHDDWYDFVPQRGDIYIETWTDGSEHKYLVEGLEPTRLGLLRPHHFEINVSQLQNQDTTIRPSV